MEKTCCICKQSKELICYHKKRSSVDGHQNICKECTKQSSKMYYSQHTEEHKKFCLLRKKKARQKNNKMQREIKASYGCQLCSEAEPCCLEFHHIKEKSFNVSEHLYKKLEHLLIEMEKCTVLCSNCHKKVHAGLLDASCCTLVKTSC